MILIFDYLSIYSVIRGTNIISSISFVIYYPILKLKNLTKLVLLRLAITQLPAAVEQLMQLETISLTHLPHLKQLPNFIFKLLNPPSPISLKSLYNSVDKDYYKFNSMEYF